MAEKQKINLDQLFALYVLDQRQKFHLTKKFGAVEKTESEWVKNIKEEGFEIQKFQ